MPWISRAAKTRCMAGVLAGKASADDRHLPIVGILLQANYGVIP